jgi:hypothetical protein
MEAREPAGLPRFKFASTSRSQASVGRLEIFQGIRTAYSLPQRAELETLAPDIGKCSGISRCKLHAPLVLDQQIFVLKYRQQ